MKGLAFKTEKLFDEVSRLDCIKPYLLVGGTSLSLQLNHRNSEDLDFMRWKVNRNDKMEVEWFTIEKELSKIGVIQKRDILDIDHVEFQVSDIKFSFYACDKYSPVKRPIDFYNNIKLSDMEGIMCSKMETLMRRSAFRDYYDIYCMLRSGLDIDDSIKAATAYSGHRLSTKNLIAILTNGERFQRESLFAELKPVFDIDSKGIETYIKDCLKMKIEFSSAIESEDFAKLIKLKESGFILSTSTIESLQKTVSQPVMIVIQKIFDLKFDVTSSNTAKSTVNEIIIRGKDPGISIDI